MKCHEVKDHLSEYLEQSLNTPQQNEVVDHLAGCSNCRKEIDELQDMLSIVHSMPRQEPVFDLWKEFAPKFAEISAAMAQERKTEKKSFFGRLFDAVREGWSMFICITGYNTARKFRYITGAE